jgi:two-component system, sensor histidine kinase FlrB
MPELPEESPSEQLQQTADVGASPEGAQLGAVFLHFVEATKALEVSQQTLSAEIHRLTEDLAKSNANLKQQIEAKRQIAEELAALLSALPTGVIILQDGIIYAFNDISSIIAPWLKVGVQWAIPKTWTAIEEQHYKTSPAEGSPIIRSETRVLADGRQMLLLHDATATFRAREESERESKLAAMGRMTAEIAHQLRTPLATATLYASHLSREDLSRENQRQFASKLNQQLAWLDDLVSRMMRFLKERPPQSEIISVYDFLNELKQSVDALFEADAVNLVFHIQGGDHLLTIHRDQIRNGIVSVLENALHVSNREQTVSVSAKAVRSRLDIFIEDEGPGINDAMIGRLFEPFATSSQRGTGLGLAIAKSAIEAHGGQINARNRAARGAVFHIVLPVLESL